VFTARYALSPYIKQIRFVFKGLTCFATNDIQTKWLALYARYEHQSPEHASVLRYTSLAMMSAYQQILLRIMGWVVNDEIKTLQKEVVVAWFEVLYRHLRGQKETHCTPVKRATIRVKF
jgi:hypothetical protein